MMFTFLKLALRQLSSVTCAEISEDSSLLAVGFNDSFIKVWSLVPQKLRNMKSADQLQDIDREAGNLFRICTKVSTHVNEDGIFIVVIIVALNFVFSQVKPFVCTLFIEY